MGVALATVTLMALHRLESHVDRRFDHVERRLDQFGERVAKLEVGQARLEGQFDGARATIADRATTSVQE